MRRFALALVAAAGVALGAVPASAATKINVFSGVSPVFAPPFVAFVKGYFKEEGLDVTVRTFQAGVAAAEALPLGRRPVPGHRRPAHDHDGGQAAMR